MKTDEEIQARIAALKVKIKDHDEEIYAYEAILERRKLQTAEWRKNRDKENRESDARLKKKTEGYWDSVNKREREAK